MINILKKLKQNVIFKNTFIYTFLQVINKSIAFFLLPILTHYLTPKDYGIIATYKTYVGFLGIFIGLNVFGAINVNFFHLNKKELAKYNGNIFLILLFSTLIVTLSIYFFQPYLVEKLKIPPIWFYIGVVAAFMRMITGINLVLWRANKQAKSYSFYLIVETLLDVLLALFLIIILHYNWEGRTISSSVTAIILGIVSIIILFKKGYMILDFSFNYIKDALKFGIPLIPHQLALWLRSGIDIFLITILIGPDQTGVYNIGLQFGAIIGLFVSSFNNAYVPHLYDTLKNITSEKKLKLVRFTYIFFIGIIIFSLILSTIEIFIIPYILDKKFIDASKYIYIISLAYAFQGMYVMVVNYIFYTKKSYLISIITISTSIIQFLLSYIFIKNFGAIGAAYSLLITYFITFILIWKISNKVFPMPWFFWRRK